MPPYDIYVYVKHQKNILLQANIMLKEKKITLKHHVLAQPEPYSLGLHQQVPV